MVDLTRITSWYRQKEFNNLFVKFIKRCPCYNVWNCNIDKNFAIVLSPWYHSAVFHFGVILGYLLGVKGYNVSFVFDDVTEYIEGDCYAERKELLGLIRKLADRKLDLVMLSSLCPLKNSEDVAVATRYANYQTIHQIKSSGFLSDNKEILDLYIEGNKKTIGHVRSFVQGFKGVLIVPGGICGSSGLFYECSQGRKDIRVASYDTGPIMESKVFVASDSVASHMHDVFKAYEKILSLGAEFSDYAVREAEKELEYRRKNELKRFMKPANKGNEETSSSKSSIHIGQFKKEIDVLILLNIEWDSAALGLDCVFSNVSTWLNETINYLKINTDTRVVIRQHPHERRLPTADLLFQWLEKNNLIGDNIEFISCYEDVNTYSLIENSKVVLPWTSTTGIEAAMLGKTVIMITDAYYSSAEFIIKCENKEGYFSEISNGIKQTGSIDEKLKRKACLMYYLSQKCKHAQTSNLYPVKECLVKLLKEDWDSIIGMGEDDFLSCITEGTVVPYVNYLKNTKKENHDSVCGM